MFPPLYQTYWRDLFTRVARNKEPNACVESRLRDSIPAFIAAQGHYQPFYGIDELKSFSNRRANLMRVSRIIAAHFTDVSSKGQVRILDVGCNSGFVTMQLAETLPSISGIDVSSTAISLSRDLASRARSSATFATGDFLTILEDDATDFENVDCVLLLNVLHQCIGARGLKYTQLAIARLARRVDVVFVQLARKEDYANSPLGQILPREPGEIFAEVRDAAVDLLDTTERPLYRITRSHVQFGGTSVRVSSQWFSRASDIMNSKKFYVSVDGSRFIKVFRYTDKHGVLAYVRERQTLLALQARVDVPTIEDWASTGTLGAIVMQRVDGKALSDAPNVDSGALRTFVGGYIDFAAAMASLGLYHNDTVPQNIMMSHSKPVFIDFDRSGTICVCDPFGMFLWTIHDIACGKISPGDVYQRLWITQGERVGTECYPEPGSLPTWLRSLAQDAIHTRDRWFEFARRWQVNGVIPTS